MRIRKQGPPDELLNDEEVLSAARVADALAHPLRIRMLRFILSENVARRTVTNKDLVEIFDYSQASVSQHISKLVLGGLLEVRKKGTSSCYFTRVGKLSVFAETLKKIEAPGDAVGLPDFLRTGFQEAADIEVEPEEELNPDYFEELLNDAFESPPHFL